MMIILSSKNKDIFVDGRIVKLGPEEKNLCATWKCNKNVIISWILNFVLKEIAKSFYLLWMCEVCLG